MSEGTVMASTPAGEGSPAAAAPAEGQPVAEGSTPAAAAPTGILSSEGNFNESWYSSDDRLAQAGTTLDRFGTPQELAHSYMELSKLRPGAPAPDAGDDVKSAFKEWVGVPDNYDVKAGEGEQFDSAILDRFTGIAKAHNGVLTNSAMQDMANEFNAVTQEARTAADLAQQEAVKSQFTAMESEHGNDWATFLNGAQQAALKLGMDPNDPAVGNDPKMVNLLGRISKMVGEGEFVGSNDSKAGWSSAGKDANDIMSNPDHPLHKAFHDTGDPRHKEANAAYDRAMNAAQRSIGRA